MPGPRLPYMEVFMHRLLLPLVLAALVSLNLTGCSGLGIRAEMYRIDDRQEQTSTKATPLKCLFTDCSARSGS